jgi:hypothetical protein
MHGGVRTTRSTDDGDDADPKRMEDEIHKPGACTFLQLRWASGEMSINSADAED